MVNGGIVVDSSNGGLSYTVSPVDKTFIACFREKVSFTVTAASQDVRKGTVALTGTEISSGTNQYEEGSTVTITPTNGSLGCTFKEWKDSSNNTYTVPTTNTPNSYQNRKYNCKQRWCSNI